MKNKVFNKKNFIKAVTENVERLYRKSLDEASQQEIYQAVSQAVKDVVMGNWLDTQKAIDEQEPKIVYYMSMEFLMGRALGNNLINLCAYNEVKEALEAGADIIMLDNMDNATMKEAVQLIDGRAETECSGNVTAERVKEIIETGVDYVSCGALTHSSAIMDVSLKNLHAI